MKFQANRKVDLLGRIVLPKEVRIALGIKAEDEVEIILQNDSVILKKPENAD